MRVYLFAYQHTHSQKCCVSISPYSDIRQRTTKIISNSYTDPKQTLSNYTKTTRRISLPPSSKQTTSPHKPTHTSCDILTISKHAYIGRELNQSLCSRLIHILYARERLYTTCRAFVEYLERTTLVWGSPTYDSKMQQQQNQQHMRHGKPFTLIRGACTTVDLVTSSSGKRKPK